MSLLPRYGRHPENPGRDRPREAADRVQRKSVLVLDLDAELPTPKNRFGPSDVHRTSACGSWRNIGEKCSGGNPNESVQLVIETCREWASCPDWPNWSRQVRLHGASSSTAHLRTARRGRS